MNSFAFSSCPIYKSYIGQTNRQRNECALLVWAILVYLLVPKPRAALDHATRLYTALGDTVKKVVELTAESITSLSNLVRSIQIRHRIMLKLQTPEQTPLIWKPGETLFNKYTSPPFTMVRHNVTTGTTCGINGLMSFKVFLNASHNFCQHFKALSITEF